MKCVVLARALWCPRLERMGANATDAILTRDGSSGGSGGSGEWEEIY